jgi:hypothetical protein
MGIDVTINNSNREIVFDSHEHAHLLQSLEHLT